MNVYGIYHNARQQGKSLLMKALIESKWEQGLNPVILTGNQEGCVARLRLLFPSAFFELVEDWGVKIHRR